MKLNELFTEADPNELGSMNDKMKDVLSKVDSDDKAKEKAAVDAADKEKLANKIKYSDSDEMKEYIKLLKSHDWTYQYSDDHSVWKRGSAEADAIRSLGDKVDPDRELYKKHSPFYDDVKDESIGEGSLDQFRNLYRKSIGSDDDAVTLRELIKVINDDSLWSDEFPQLKQFTSDSPDSGSRIVTAKDIPGNSADEKIEALVKAIDDDEWVDDTAKHLMRSFTLDDDVKDESQYTPTRDKEDYFAKKKALQDLQADPNTAKDPELQKELIKRKKALDKDTNEHLDLLDIIKLAGMEESATAGATSAGNIASIPNPQLSPGNARGKKSYTGDPWGGKSGTKSPSQPKVKQPKTAQGTAKNALDMKNSIFGENPVRR